MVLLQEWETGTNDAQGAMSYWLVPALAAPAQQHWRVRRQYLLHLQAYAGDKSGTAVGVWWWYAMSTPKGFGTTYLSPAARVWTWCLEHASRMHARCTCIAALLKDELLPIHGMAWLTGADGYVLHEWKHHMWGSSSGRVARAAGCSKAANQSCRTVARRGPIGVQTRLLWRCCAKANDTRTDVPARPPHHCLGWLDDRT